ncbi:MAG: hypothetical protein NZ703_04085 [Gemmataceae bacterium]|nr:hypothetical protein [Gemmataceae bacterium]MCS7270241.1 hypothetical protein [Gemmataceae bacterium]
MMAWGWLMAGMLAIANNGEVQKLDPGRYGWLSDYAAARAEARRTGKPIFLVFRCEP